MNAQNAWEAVRGQLQMDMPKATFDTWVRDAVFIEFVERIFKIGVKNAYARDWLENRLTSTIFRSLKGCLPEIEEVVFEVHIVDSDSPALQAGDEPAEKPIGNPPEPHTLPSRFTLAKLVWCPGNAIPKGAAQAIAASGNKAPMQNPLFVWGAPGIGKTHLLVAVANEFSGLGGSLKVLYVTSEQFTNELVNAIRTHTTQAFRDKYRTVDILLIDDIQFIEGKQATMDELFHTLNELVMYGKQVVIASDRPPDQMPIFEKRLLSRLKGGLCIAMELPIGEYLEAIARNKAEEFGYKIPDEILTRIALLMDGCNIRELEGAIHRVWAYFTLWGKPLTVETVDLALADLRPAKGVTPEALLKIVVHVTGIPTAEILSQNRNANVSRARHLYMHFLHQGGMGPSDIARLLGRDHSTVNYGLDKIEGSKSSPDVLNIQSELDAIRNPVHV